MTKGVRPFRSTYRVISTTYRLKEQILSESPQRSLLKTIQRTALAAAFLVLAASMIVQLAVAQEQAPPAIAATGTSRVALANSTHPATRAAADLGRVAPEMAMGKMVMVLAGDAGQEQSLNGLL